MLKRIKEFYIAKKVAKLKELQVFHQKLDGAHYQLGKYGTGVQRAFEILLETNTKESFSFKDVRIEFNQNNDLIIKAKLKNQDIYFYKVFKKEDIKWKLFHHGYKIGLNERLRMCLDPNGGNFDIPLKNGESIILGYTFDESKRHKLVEQR